MKNNIFKTLLYTALATPLLASCELDQFPEGTISPEDSWESASDISHFNTGLLARLRGYSGGAYNYVSDIQSDLFNATVGTADENQTYDWTFTNGQFNGDVVWIGGYALIKEANNIINNIDKAQLRSNTDSLIWAQTKANAFFSRALAYNTMAQRYCVNYDPSQDMQAALGLPIVTNVDINEIVGRSSLADTYAYIVENVMTADSLYQQAITYISRLNDKEQEELFKSTVVPIIGTNAAPSGAANLALLSRVMLNMKDYEMAINAAMPVMEAFPLAEEGDYSTMWYTDEGSEIIYQPYMTVDERGGSYAGIYSRYDVIRDTWNPSYLPTQGLLDLYEDNDERKMTFFLADYQISAGEQKYNGEAYYFHKFPGNENLRKTGETELNTWYNMPKVFRSSELYLIVAESYKMLGDDADALKYLNALRTTRGASEQNLSGDALFDCIKDEWTREMVGEGFRLNCLKRWNDGVKRMKPQDFGGTKILLNDPPENYTELNVQPGSDRYFKMIWEIPSQTLQAAQGAIEKNWPEIK